MKILYINGVEEQSAERIVKDDNNIKGFNGNKQIFEYPSISKIEEFTIGDGQEWDIEVDEIAQLKVSQAIQFETLLNIIGGM